MDVKYFYLNNNMYRAEYIMIQISTIPQEFIIAYNLKDTVHNIYIFTRRSKGMYELLQKVKITHNALVLHLAPYGYHPSRKIPGLWIHSSHPINLTLVVNDFGVIYLVK